MNVSPPKQTLDKIKVYDICMLTSADPDAPKEFLNVHFGLVGPVHKVAVPQCWPTGRPVW